MSGELPLLSLRISDDKLRSVVALVESIPLPESRSAARTAPSSTTKVTTGTEKKKYLTEIIISSKLLCLGVPHILSYFLLSQGSHSPPSSLPEDLWISPTSAPLSFLSHVRPSASHLWVRYIIMLPHTQDHCTKNHVTGYVVTCNMTNGSLCVGRSGSEEDLFYDAPSSPIGDRPFFPDNPMPLRSSYLNKIKSLAKEDPQKNMIDFMMTFEINEVKRDLVELGDKHYFLFHISCVIHLLLFNVGYTYFLDWIHWLEIQ